MNKKVFVNFNFRWTSSLVSSKSDFPLFKRKYTKWNLPPTHLQKWIASKEIQNTISRKNCILGSTLCYLRGRLQQDTLAALSRNQTALQMQYWIGILGIFKTLEKICLLIYYSTILVIGYWVERERGGGAEGQIKDNLQIEKLRSVAIRRRQSRSAFFVFSTVAPSNPRQNCFKYSNVNFFIVLRRSSGEALHC